MNAILTLPGRRFLPLLAVGCLLAGLPSPARGGMLNSRFTDQATLGLSSSSVPCLTARIVYDSQRDSKHRLRDAPSSQPSAFAALALTLIIPAGTVPIIPDWTPPPPVLAPPPPPPPPPPPSPPPPPPSTPQPPPGGGHVAGAPEPATLMLALSGSGMACLVWFRRRRANSSATNG